MAAFQGPWEPGVLKYLCIICLNRTANEITIDTETGQERTAVMGVLNNQLTDTSHASFSRMAHTII